MRRKTLFIITLAAIIQGCGSILPKPAAPVAVPAATPATLPAAVAPAPHRAQRSEALLQALMALGVDYKYGGKTPVSGFDCSGLVAHVYRQAWGISLPPTVKGQSQAGWPVKLLELQPGDLVFYDTQKRPYSHVGIYLGDGKFVHSPRTGAQVRVESIKAAYWAQRFNGARRIEPEL